MTAIVIDASVAIAWCFPHDEGNEAADAVAMQIITRHAVVPGIFWYEMRNVLVGAERSGRIDRQGTANFLERLDQLRIEVNHAHEEAKTLALARRYRLTVYDAAYLETAIRRQAALATLDTDLAAAAGHEGVVNPVS